MFSLSACVCQIFVTAHEALQEIFPAQMCAEEEKQRSWCLCRLRVFPFVIISVFHCNSVRPSGVPAAPEAGVGGGRERRKLLSGRETAAVRRQSAAETVQGKRRTQVKYLTRLRRGGEVV